MTIPKGFIALGALPLLAACGGGGSGLGSFSSFADYSALEANTVFATDTAPSVINASSARVNYDGIANIVLDDGPAIDGYLGSVDVTVDFGADSMTGTVDGFSQWMDDTVALPSLRKAPGSISMDATLTGLNSSLGDALAGAATGTVDGTPVLFDVEGSFSGPNAEGISLWFDGVNGGGVALGLD